MEYPSSTLRYGLLDVKPILVSEVKKKYGIKILTKTIRYEPEKPIEKYEDLANIRYGQIFSRIPLPESYSLERILEYFVKKDVEKYRRDDELKKELKKKEAGLLGFVKFFKNRFEKELPEYYSAEADRFLRSNLPLSFFTQTSMFINTYQKYLTLVKEIAGRYESLAVIRSARYRDSQVEQPLGKMKQILSPLIDKMDLLVVEILTLKMYVCIWCAENFEEIDNPRFLDFRKMDSSILDEFALGYNNELKNMRRMMYEASATYIPTLFHKEVSQDNSATTMLGKLLSSRVPTGRFT